MSSYLHQDDINKDYKEMATVFNKIFVNKLLLLNTENVNFTDPAARFKLITIEYIYIYIYILAIETSC